MPSSPDRSPTLHPWPLVGGALALASGGWAAFLWQQLFVARSGEDPFCALGGGGCAALWDGAFASAVHDASGLPVAAWGLVWSGAALVACLLTWNQDRSGRDPEPFWSGASLLALAGVAAVVLLLAASLFAGEFCSNCAITYLLVAAYAGAVYVGSSLRKPKDWGRGTATAAATGVALFLVLLSPGLDTPKAGAQLGGAALEAAGSVPASMDDELQRFLGSLPEREQKNLAIAMARYVDAPSVAARGRRSAVGSANAPTVLTTFTDSGCSHCANFHEALEAMLAQLPPDALAVEQRMFPLDGACNPHVRGRGRDFLCLAAQVRVCLEEHPKALELSGWLHEDASPLSTASVYRVATRIAKRDELEQCVVSKTTNAKLQDDIEMALEAGLQGTPYLLLNGKPAATYLPFLYAMVLAEANTMHPAFAELPEIDLASLPDPHAGHDH